VKMQRSKMQNVTRALLRLRSFSVRAKPMRDEDARA